MSVIQVRCDGFSFKPGTGTDRFFQNLITEIHRQNGNEVCLDIVSGSRLGFLPGSLRQLLLRHYFWPRREENCPADIVWGSKYLLPTVPVSTKSVLTCHGLWFMNQEQSQSLADRYVEHCFRRSLVRANKVVCISHALQREMQAQFPEIEKKLCTIPHGISSAFRRKVSGVSTERPFHQLTGGAPYLLWVGNDQPVKKLDWLLQQWWLLQAEIPHHLILLGNVSQRWMTVPRCHVVPTVTEESTMADIYSAATALIIPSQSEGFGLPVLEAIACGCPVFTFRLPVFEEYFGDRINFIATGGFVEQLIQFIEDAPVSGVPDERWYRQWGWANRAASYLKLFRELVAE